MDPIETKSYKPMSTRSKIKITFLSLGIAWTSVVITLHTLKKLDMADQRDFYCTTFLACAAGLGLQKKSTETAPTNKDNTDA